MERMEHDRDSLHEKGLAGFFRVSWFGELEGCGIQVPARVEVVRSESPIQHVRISNDSYRLIIPLGLWREELKLLLRDGPGFPEEPDRQGLEDRFEEL